MSKVTVVKNGPIIITGHKEMPTLELIKPDGTIEVGEKFALCRCGKSLNKLFCDGSHANSRHDEWSV
jgi:CDGSH-type Zn-finger protein